MESMAWIRTPGYERKHSRESPLGDRGLVERKAEQYAACPSTPVSVRVGASLWVWPVLCEVGALS